MDSTEYRARAEQLLTSRRHPLDLDPAYVAQAAVWAALAQAAAVTETALKQEQESTR